jgi:hypothetical protein
VKENLRLSTQRLDMQLKEGKWMMKRGVLEHEHKFHKIFYRMSYMVEKLYVDYEKRVSKKDKKKKVKRRG